MSNKKKAYYDQPWWKSRNTQVMDFVFPNQVGIEEVVDGKVVKRIDAESDKPFTLEVWSKMHSDAIAKKDAELKAEWDSNRKEKTALKRLFKELNK
tara:strand:- start:384 stop:671 length:288 start_codon:yes stop_codon:yes gene_type:complete